MPGTTASSLKTSPPKLIPGAWLVVALLCVVGCLNYLDRLMIATMRESIVEAMPMTDAQFGLLTSVFLWVYGLLSPFAGFLADRFNRSRVIIVSLFVWSAVTWLTSHATTFEQLLATRALMGISEACYIPAALALIADYHRGHTRSLATGIHMAGIMIGQSLGFIGGWIAENGHWSDAFSVFGALGVAYALVLVFFLRDVPENKDLGRTGAEQPEKKVSFIKGIISLFSRGAFILALTYWGLLGLVSSVLSVWLPTYYKEKFHLSQTIAGVYGTSYIYPAALVGVLLGGFWAARWSRTNVRAPILVPAIGLCVAAPGIFIAGNTGILPLVIVGFIIYALTRAFTDSNMMPILCLVADPRFRATGYGILNLFSCVVGGFGIYAGGILRDSNIDLSSMFQFAALILLSCAALLFLLKPKFVEDTK